MPSHFSSIGLPVHNEEEFRQLLDRIASRARSIDVPGGRYLEWTSGTGAQVLIQVNRDNEVIGVNPHFGGGARLRAAVTAAVARPDDSPLDGAFHAWAEPEDDDPETGCYPFVFDCPDALAYGDLALPQVTEVQVAAFAHSVDVWKSVDEYDAADHDSPKFASQSFIPSGLFSPGGESTEPPGASAIFTGHIGAGELRTNELTGVEFFWASVSSLCGEFDVVIDPELLATAIPEAGGVLQGEFWLTGRLANLTNQRPRRGWVSRLMGKAQD